MTLSKANRDLQLGDQVGSRLESPGFVFFCSWIFPFQLSPTSSVSFSRPHGTQAQKGRNNKKQILAPGALRPDAARQAEISHGEIRTLRGKLVSLGFEVIVKTFANPNIIHEYSEIISKKVFWQNCRLVGCFINTFVFV